MNPLHILAQTTTDLSEQRIKGLLSEHSIAINDVYEDVLGYYPTTLSVRRTAFTLACDEGNLITAQNLVSCGADPTPLGRDGETVAHQAAYTGYLDMLQWLFREFPQLCLQNSQNGQNIASWAASGGQLDVLQWVSSEYPYLCLDTSDEHNNNIAFNAAAGGHLDVLKWISSEYPTLCTHVSKYGWNIAHSAATDSHYNVLNWCFEKYPYLLFQREEGGNLPREIAGYGGHHSLDDSFLKCEMKYFRKEAMFSLLLGTLKQNESSPIHKAYFQHWACEYQLLPLIMDMYMYTGGEEMFIYTDDGNGMYFFERSLEKIVDNYEVRES